MSGWSNNFSEYNAAPEVFHITGIAFDTSNRPWLGNCGNCTWGRGLSYYDGENWETFSEENSGLVSNRVVEVAIDSNDRVWVGYSWYRGDGDHGVSVFDGETWTTYTKENSGLFSNAVDKIVVDPSNRVWIGYGGEDAPGVSVFDGETWTTYTKENSGLISNAVDKIVIDPSNRVWIGYGEDTLGVSVFDGETWTTYTKENSGLISNAVDEIAIDPSNRVWIDYGGEDTLGVSVFNGESWTTYTRENSGLASNKVCGIAFDTANNAWIGTKLGVSVFDGENWTTYTREENGLLGYCGLLIDSSDRVWVSKWKQGVAVFDGASWMVFTEDNSGLVSNKIRYMVVDRAGKIWFITSDGVSVPPENPTPIPPYLVMIRNALFSPKLSLWVTLSLLAGFEVIGCFTVGERTATTKRLGVSLAFACLGFIAGPLCVGVILGLLGWGDESLLFGLLFLGVPIGLFFGFWAGVVRIISIKGKNEKDGKLRLGSITKWSIIVISGILGYIIELGFEICFGEFGCIGLGVLFGIVVGAIWYILLRKKSVQAKSSDG
jgi:sugar lactone lactonase YvrE